MEKIHNLFSEFHVSICLVFAIVTLLVKANNENTPKATLVDAVVPYVVCSLRFCSSSFSRDVRKRVDQRIPFS